MIIIILKLVISGLGGDEEEKKKGKLSGEMILERKNIFHNSLLQMVKDQHKNFLVSFFCFHNKVFLYWKERKKFIFTQGCTYAHTLHAYIMITVMMFNFFREP